ncbi:hypothetical protein CCACVL1_19073 [Corchorus capsularis]|uniref:Protein kinase domain-containing protein n=1 Tax=Corchorus capsularis TaxID=210143 RepID=A0A1R3HIM9_COCAP|nr:hypothetical protein CCACVL1_19073 [Corchorus capsularis]
MVGYTMNPEDYKLLEIIGDGATATVYKAIHVPTTNVVAVKVLDLDLCNDGNLDKIRRETQTMNLINHPNIIKAHCSFVVERKLWSAIKSILKETLKALDYLHKQGHIHRDVKAGNILLDKQGTVKLADFGVSACMFDAGDRQRGRNTFVGTPCWMAPEVLQESAGGSGYNYKADIWSFGITALELAHGHAPFSEFPPMKVFLMTLQNAPPGFDDSDHDKKFSKSFKHMVATCLVKDPRKRPTTEKLLKHPFFKHAKPPEVSVKKLLAKSPKVWNGVKTLDRFDEQLVQSKKLIAEEEASSSQYQRGISAWNFDIEDLKAQAALLPDEDDDN